MPLVHVSHKMHINFTIVFGVFHVFKLTWHFQHIYHKQKRNCMLLDQELQVVMATIMQTSCNFTIFHKINCCKFGRDLFNIKGIWHMRVLSVLAPGNWTDY